MQEHIIIFSAIKEKTGKFGYTNIKNFPKQKRSDTFKSQATGQQIMFVTYILDVGIASEVLIKEENQLHGNKKRHHIQTLEIGVRYEAMIENRQKNGRAYLLQATKMKGHKNT